MLAARRNSALPTVRDLLMLGREGRQHDRATEASKVNLPEVRLGPTNTAWGMKRRRIVAHPELFWSRWGTGSIVHLEKPSRLMLGSHGLPARRSFARFPVPRFASGLLNTQISRG
jgi:hypothetical protein